MVFNQQNDLTWNRLQQPLRPTNQPDDYMLLLSALDDGWQILEAIRIFSRNHLGEEKFYMITLMHPNKLHESKISVKNGEQINKLLASENVPVSGLFSPHTN